MSACDIKTVGEANNLALTSFKKAYLLSGGNMNKSLKFAINETKKNFPNLNFDVNTLTGPIIDTMKRSGAISANYKFGKKQSKVSTKSLTELANKIANEETEKRPDKKTSTLTDEEKERKAHINSKYNKNLNDEQFRKLEQLSVDNTPIKDIVKERVAEEKAAKQAEKSVIEAEKTKAKLEESISKAYDKSKEAEEDRAKKIEALAQKVIDGDEDVKKAKKKTTTLTKEDQENRAYINRKYNQNLTESQYFDFMNQVIGGEFVKDIVKERVAEEKAAKQAEREDSAVTRKINNLAGKMEGLSDAQKKSLVKDLTDEFQKSGILDDQRVRDLYAKALGVPHMDEETKAVIDEVSNARKEVDDIDKEIRDAAKSLKSNPNAVTSAQVADMAKRIGKANVRSRIASKNLAKALQAKGFWISDFADQVPLNLMSTLSLLKNATGVIPDAFIRHMQGAVSGMVNMIMRPFTKVNTNPFAARFTSGGKRIREAFTDAGIAFKYKTRKGQGMPHQDNMNVAYEWKKAIDAHGAKKFAHGLAAVLKISPDFITRTLLATDAIPKSLAYNGELGRIAESKGLTGAAKDLFILYPDAESHEKAIEYAKDVTFENDITLPIVSTILKSLQYDHRAAADKLVKEKGIPPWIAHTTTSMVKLGLGVTVPFIKVPTNIIKKALKLATPEMTLIFTAARLASVDKNKTWDVKQKMITDAIGSAAVGYYIRSVAIQLVAAGAMSAGYDDDEPTTRDNTERIMGGNNQINVTAAVRAIFGLDPKQRTGDSKVPMSYLGAFGITMGAYSTAFNSMSGDEIQKYNDKIISKASPDIIGKTFTGTMKAALENPFMTAQNNIIKALSDKEGDKVQKLGINVLATISGGILPAQYQKLSMANTPEIASRFDKEKTFGENLATEFGYKFSFMNKDVKKKYFTLTSKGESAKKMKKQVLFDEYFGRAMASAFDIGVSEVKIGTPDYKMYQAQRNEPVESRGELFPKAPAPELVINKERYKLTPEQHEFLQEKASEIRMVLATPYIMSVDWDKSNYSTRVTKLKEYYEQGLDAAIKLTKKKYPAINKQEVVTRSTTVNKEDIDKKIVNKTYK